jgi:hypothetical protein
VASFETELQNLFEQIDEKHAKSQTTRWSRFEQKSSEYTLVALALSPVAHCVYLRDILQYATGDVGF